MRTTFFSLCLIAMATLTFTFVGCGQNSSKKPVASDTGTSSSHDGDADHDDHAGHDHGDDAEHDHPKEGPHGGHLIELGDEEYHAELLHNEKKHTVTVYLLDGPAKQAVAIPTTEITIQLFENGQFVKYTLKAVRQPEDPADAASRFEITDAALCDAMSHENKTRGRLQLTIKGKPYTGTIQHTSHGQHDHDGDDHAGDDHAGHQH